MVPDPPTDTQRDTPNGGSPSRSAETLATWGVRFTYRHRVRYRECDRMGVVYHTHYLDYFEAARTEALRKMGVTYRELEDSGVFMPVTGMSVVFLRPAFYDDVLLVTALVDPPPPRMRVETRYEVRRDGEEALLATGEVNLCFLNSERRRPIPAPDHVAAAFSRAFEHGSSS